MNFRNQAGHFVDLVLGFMLYCLWDSGVLCLCSYMMRNWGKNDTSMKYLVDVLGFLFNVIFFAGFMTVWLYVEKLREK